MSSKVVSKLFGDVDFSIKREQILSFISFLFY